MQYIHLSGSDLLVKMARSVEHGDAKLGPSCCSAMIRSPQPSDSLPYARKSISLRYDRTPELTSDECQIASRWAGRERPVITRKQLPRLHVPLVDVLSSPGISPAERSTTIKIMLIQFGRSKQPYWGWSDDQWLALINRQLTRTGLLLATAYLLSGLSDSTTSSAKLTSW